MRQWLAGKKEGGESYFSAIGKTFLKEKEQTKGELGKASRVERKVKKGRGVRVRADVGRDKVGRGASGSGERRKGSFREQEGGERVEN